MEGVKAHMKESLGQLVGGYSQAPHASYSFNAFIIDGKICFEEEYNTCQGAEGVSQQFHKRA